MHHDERAQCWGTAIDTQAEVKSKFEMGEVLGQGNFAVVKVAKTTDKRKKDKDSPPIPDRVAIKIIDKSKVEDMNDIDREVEIMHKLEHKNIIRLYEIYDEPKKMNLVSPVHNDLAGLALHTHLRVEPLFHACAGDGVGDWW